MLNGPAGKSFDLALFFGIPTILIGIGVGIGYLIWG